MSLLEHPQALVLWQDAELTPQAVVSCRGRLVEFLQRYLPWFYRAEQRESAQVIIAGKLSHLQRKTTEPIALQAQCKRKPLQDFVGGKWDDDAVHTQMWQHIDEERDQPPTPREISAKVTQALLRNEGARIYHWQKCAGRFPPRRGTGEAQASSPRKKRRA